ncbi:MAG: exodeoxyribonuclease VII large subunit [Planctomycetes bacterium]|nr:exodeoxyribonuclease VII large subunit [Planctomycetota bacterium]
MTARDRGETASDLFTRRDRAEDTTGRDVLSVTELTQQIKKDLETSFHGIWVAGEISNLSRPNSGHVYLTLKDEKTQLSGVIWRSAAARLRFELKDGLAVVVHGDITVYPPRGAYQIIVKRVMPRGMGALQLAFLQMKDKLEKEGLFAPEHKRPLPFIPRRIGIVTSPSGAAIRDILKQISRRFPGAQVLLYPALVQGKQAAEEIAGGIHALNEYGGLDVMIVGRGGGSIEDLWAFNEEVVARAIFSSQVPVISAVGHEVDVTISDLVADARALTPTAAGEMAVPDRAELTRHLDLLQEHLRQSLVNKVDVARARLQSLAQATVLRRPLEAVRTLQQGLDERFEDLRRTSGQWLAILRERMAAIAGRLESLSPLKVLARGYSITIRPDGTVVRKATQVSAGDTLKTRLSEGAFTSTVESILTEDG